MALPSERLRVFDQAVQMSRRVAALRDEWNQQLDAERDRFVDQIISRGFRLVETTPQTRLVGELTHPPKGKATAVEILLPDGWPYRPTKVRPTEWARPLTWHQEADGSLCLFPTSAAGLPWKKPDCLLTRAARWFEEAAAGWPNDEPDLDLERYFTSSSSDDFLVYEDLKSLLGRPIKTSHASQGILKLRVSRRAVPGGTRYGWALDLGELSTPVRTWEEILGHFGDQAAGADRLIQTAKSAIILLRYRRGTHEGVVALRAKLVDGNVRLESIESADKGSRTLRLRAGYDADDLARFTVAVVGVGAIGSVVADLLSRSGIGKLLLLDGERMRPGNHIRHLIRAGFVGQPKAEAVAKHIQTTDYSPSAGVYPFNVKLRTPEEVAEVFHIADLVVDAAADPTTTELLIGAAESLEKGLLVTYLQRDGDVARLERYPMLESEDQEPPVPPQADKRELLRESGCGDPVSPASPSSVWASAGLASLAAADLLLARGLPPALTYVLRPQPEQTYRHRSVRP